MARRAGARVRSQPTRPGPRVERRARGGGARLRLHERALRAGLRGWCQRADRRADVPRSPVGVPSPGRDPATLGAGQHIPFDEAVELHARVWSSRPVVRAAHGTRRRRGRGGAATSQQPNPGTDRPDRTQRAALRRRPTAAPTAAGSRPCRDRVPCGWRADVRGAAARRDGRDAGQQQLGRRALAHG